jgi:hypothetical protein
MTVGAKHTLELMFNRTVSNRRSARSTLIHGGPGPIRSGPSSTRRPWPIPTRTRAINSAALHHERCRDRGVSAVPGDTWPMCALSHGQLCLDDQVDLDTLTAELLAGCDHQTVEPTASCSGCGRRSPRPDGQPWPESENQYGSRSACFLIPSAAGCLTRLTDHRDRRQGGGAGGAVMPDPQAGAPAAARASECAQAGERRQRSDLRPVRDHGGTPCCACYKPTSTLPTPRWPPRSNAPSFPASEWPSGWRSGSAGCSPAWGCWSRALAQRRDRRLSQLRGCCQGADTAVVVLSNTARSVGRLRLRLLKALASGAGQGGG